MQSQNSSLHVQAHVMLKLKEKKKQHTGRRVNKACLRIQFHCSRRQSIPRQFEEIPTMSERILGIVSCCAMWFQMQHKFSGFELGGSFIQVLNHTYIILISHDITCMCVTSKCLFYWLQKVEHCSISSNTFQICLSQCCLYTMQRPPSEPCPN